MTTEKQEKVSLIRRLRSDGLENNSLPVKFRKGGAIWKWRWHWSSTSSANPSYPVPEDWGRNETQLFYAYQWMFNVPCFGFGQPFRFRFENDTILPYLELEHKAESKGFFGEVFKVKIHQAHINIPELAGKARNGSVDIALKKANNDPELAKYFDKEAKNLEKLRTYKSKHLIKPIAAYEHRGDRCLIFPWADKGNLYQYWGQCDGNPEMSWITHQLSGLFSALKELHQANCRHGDLKPENILLYVNEANDTILQIADLGLTTFHEQDASTRIRRAANLHTATPPGTSRYEPPETDQDRVEDQNKGIEDRIKNPEVHEARSRAYDIWSMGCIVLELLIWLSNGFDTVDKFRKKTPYLWERDGTDYRIQKHAREHIEAMSKKWKPNSACGDLLKFVQNRLLVIKVSNNNESSPDHRETAAVAWKKMREIQRKHYPV
ncbi:heterokaryon incompatibility protein [Colletotrichum tofieldiae]|nr:heterokaryon incompatibility protein [Colletotrichum tofieldiae]